MSARLGGAILALLACWQAVVLLSGLPPYILPAPAAVGHVLMTRADIILGHAAITAAEILAGLLLGTLLGAAAALAIDHARLARTWLLPLVIASQAIPVFALAPILVLWFGYGLASKVAMAALIIFFPVTVAFLDGLRRTDTGWLDLARTMAPAGRRGRFAILLRIRIPAALPAFGSGLRVAAAVAPIGAVIGEWVGSSAGLGHLMLHANGRMQIDLMFAALSVLAALALTLYFAIDALLRRLMPWAPERFLDQSEEET
ncbi:MAG: ABC transporter permease [Alphaproteobacteria bacterium]|nr:ABC transporter permease [Alphaproteobacteria bacterium]